MRYAIEGVVRSTRKATFREINADGEPEAVQLAGAQGISVKRIWRVADDAPPARPPSATSRQGQRGSAPWLALLCYFVAILAFIAAVAIRCGQIVPISSLAVESLQVMIPGMLLLIAGAQFHMIKLLRVIASRGDRVPAEFRQDGEPPRP